MRLPLFALQGYEGGTRRKMSNYQSHVVPVMA